MLPQLSKHDIQGSDQQSCNLLPPWRTCHILPSSRHRHARWPTSVHPGGQPPSNVVMDGCDFVRLPRLVIFMPPRIVTSKPCIERSRSIWRFAPRSVAAETSPQDCRLGEVSRSELHPVLEWNAKKSDGATRLSLNSEIDWRSGVSGLCRKSSETNSATKSYKGEFRKDSGQVIVGVALQRPVIAAFATPAVLICLAASGVSLEQ